MLASQTNNNRVNDINETSSYINNHQTINYNNIYILPDNFNVIKYWDLNNIKYS